jgi:hypothetical protein
VEIVVGFYGKMNMMRCQICTQIEGRKTLMASKFDNLKKCFRRWKCKVTITNCIVGQSYMSMKSQHAKMIAYPIEGECIHLQTWLLRGTWLEKGKENSYNLLHFVGF